VSYLTVASHRSMALDVRRNAAYRDALAAIIRPDSVVLDLGAGTGVLGMMAARLGARRVYLVEPEEIVSVAEELVAANGLQDRVRCIRGRIEDVQLPERVDVIVSVLTGNFLLTEDLLPTLFHARDSWLEPGGQLIPGAASMEAVPVSAPAVHEREVASWSAAQHGVDLSVARAYAANTIFYRHEQLRDVTPLAEPQVLHTVDLVRDGYEGVSIATTAEIRASGPCHGWIGWLNLKLGDAWLSTSPFEPRIHWSAAYLPLDPPMTFERGERVGFSLDRAPFGDWTWTVTSAAGRQQHSTLLSSPMTAESLQKAARGYAPALNADGRIMNDLLSRCDGSHSVDAIARWLVERHPTRFRSPTEALSFAQRMTRHFA
jgi:precorrin-6B methylase 2